MTIRVRLSMLMPIQTDLDLDPSQSFTQVEKSETNFNFYSQHCQSTLFHLSRQRHRCHNVQYLQAETEDCLH
jgi:hypothetical protein